MYRSQIVFRLTRLSSYWKNGFTNHSRGLAITTKPIVLENIVSSLSTEGKTHTLTMTVDQALRAIKFGTIDKTFAALYCDYLVRLVRESSIPEDRRYYANNAMNLADYLMRQNIHIKTKINLLIEGFSSRDIELIKAFCNSFSNLGLWKELGLSQMAVVLEGCYNLGLWELASLLMRERGEIQSVSASSIDAFVQNLVGPSRIYASGESSPETKERLRTSILSHLFDIIRDCSKNNVRFELDETSKIDSFIDSLRLLDIKVITNPSIGLISGRCKNCSTRIPTFPSGSIAALNESLLNLIENGIQDRSLMISPGQMDRFKTFVQGVSSKHRIDLVIDALNIACLAKNPCSWQKSAHVDENLYKTTKIINVGSVSQCLVNIIIRGKFLQSHKNIVLIGRQHMHSWPGLMSFLKKNRIAYFFSENEVEDDLFMLYCATLNPETEIVTCDLYRDHIARLDEKSQNILVRWMDTHQIFVNNRTMQPRFPGRYLKFPSVSENRLNFHIPITDMSRYSKVVIESQIRSLQNDPKYLTWICCETQ